MTGSGTHLHRHTTWWLGWSVVVTCGIVAAGRQWGPARLLGSVVVDALAIGGTYAVFHLLLPGLPARLPHRPRAIALAAVAVVVSLVTFVVVALWFVPLAWTLLVVGLLTFPGVFHRRSSATSDGTHP